MTKKEKLTKKEPFKPCVNIMECIHFDPERPETYTASPLMNAVLRAVAAVGPHSPKAICDYLCVPSRLLWPAVQLLTGMDQNLFRLNIAINRLNDLKFEHPEWSTDQLAQAIGYSSRADIYRLLGREDYNEEFSNKTQEHRYAKNRMAGKE